MLIAKRSRRISPIQRSLPTIAAEGIAPVFGAGSLAKILPTIFEADQWSILRGHKFGRNVLSDGGNREKRESSKGE